MTTTETGQLLAALTRQEELLKRLIATLDKPKLGLHNDAGTTYIFCNRQHGCLWYSLDADRNPQPINHSALTGYIKQVKFEKLQRRQKECYKLLVSVEADRTYILEAGSDTNFTKSLLVAIALLSPTQLRTPVTIMPAPGDDDSVLFCRLWCGGEYIKTSYDESVNFREIAKAAIANVRAAAETPF